MQMNAKYARQRKQAPTTAPTFYPKWKILPLVGDIQHNPEKYCPPQINVITSFQI
jgi:hypothetical protein